MLVLLVQIGGKLPNVALMRAAAHHRALGDELAFRWVGNRDALEPGLWDEEPDIVYASVIFKWDRPLAERLLELYPSAVVGGTGWNLTTKLEDYGITTKAQDYSLYPGFTGSIGFSQRGCRLRCDFCVVPKTEGAVRDEQTIAEIWRGEGHPRHLHLLDNDFFGAPRWRERALEIHDGKFKVCFNQGINARFLDDEAAETCAWLDCRDDSFRERRIYTAWDSKKDEKRLFDGLERLVHYGFTPRELMVYVLIGFDREGKPAKPICADDLYRQEKLRAFGARPYPMPYDRDTQVHLERPDRAAELRRVEIARGLVGFGRWVIPAYDKRVTWDAWVAAEYRPEKLGLKQADQMVLFGGEA